MSKGVMAAKNLGAGLAALVIALALVAVPVSVAAPPDELVQPETIFAEDFEAGSAPALLTDYRSGSYVAHPQWASVGFSNGIVLGMPTPQWFPNYLDTDELPAWRRFGHFGKDVVVAPRDQAQWENKVDAYRHGNWTSMMAIANAAGDFHDSTAQTNHALVSLTSLLAQVDQPMTAGQSILETTAPVVSQSGFYTFSMDGAAVACENPVRHPKLTAMLVDEDGNTTTLGTFNPCTGEGLTVTKRPYYSLSTGKDDVRDVWASAMKPGAPIKISNGKALRLRIVNNTDQPYGAGNDYGIDNLAIESLTPHVSRQFQPASGTTWDFSQKSVSYTITNTTDLLAKDGWAFTDKLPDGLRIGSTSSENTCGAEVSVSKDGALEVSGSLTKGQKTCRISVSVTAELGGADSRVFDATPITVVEALRDDTLPLAWGVYRDDDRDGVPNTEDRCPKTIYPHEVDGVGCAVEQINTPNYEAISVMRGSVAMVKPPSFDDPTTGTKETKPSPKGATYLIGAKAPKWASVNLDGSISVNPSYQITPGDYWVPITVVYADGAKAVTQARVRVLDLPKPLWEDASTDPSTSVTLPNVGEHPSGTIGSYTVDGPGDLRIGADGTVSVTPKPGCRVRDKIHVSVWLRDGSLADTFSVTITEPKEIGYAQVTSTQDSATLTLPYVGHVSNPGLIVDGPATAIIDGNRVTIRLKPGASVGQRISVFITDENGRVIGQVTVDVVNEAKPSGLPKTGF